jgi:hypothetical protein
MFMHFAFAAFLRLSKEWRVFGMLFLIVATIAQGGETVIMYKPSFTKAQAYAFMLSRRR